VESPGAGALGLESNGRHDDAERFISRFLKAYARGILRHPSPPSEGQETGIGVEPDNATAADNVTI
jgi:hypothetical protein